MENEKKIAIITDGSVPMGELAGKIAAIIGGETGYSAAVLPADGFSGTDILPVYAFFLGCESPNPPSFSYLESLFGHINLIGRPCGVFSSSPKTVKYLSALIRDSESAAGKPFLAKDGAADGELKNWVKGILREQK